MHKVSSCSVIVMKVLEFCRGIPKVLWVMCGVYLVLFFHIGMGVSLYKSVLCLCGCSGIARVMI